MKRYVKDEHCYPFSWLDEQTELTLNPAKTDVKNLSGEVLQAIAERLPAEFRRVGFALKGQGFSLYSGKHIRVMAGQYDMAIRILVQQAQVNLSLVKEDGLLRDTGQLLLDGLNELYTQVKLRYAPYLRSGTTGVEAEPVRFKVLCRLSVDQIAIVLKAADDLQLLVARSLSLVLRNIVPFLSTERLKDFSWKSARSSVYKMEGNDKEIVIRVLEALIEKIKEY